MSDTILIVDDETDLLEGLRRTITSELDCRCLTATNGEEALKIVTSNPIDLVLTDINMAGMDGITLLKAIGENDPSITVIMMTAYGTIETAVETLKKGAYDFIQKPFEFEDLLRLLKKGVEHNRLVRENNRLQQRLCEVGPMESMIGKSSRMQTVYSQIRTLAKTDVTVLILGETGTGKDLAAQAIHASSNRRNRQLVTVNCPALPDNLLESELFGHLKGAFTGADSNKRGLFDQAEGSTIFLDEIGDLPLSLQTKLLRVLHNQEIKPVGAEQTHQVDVRVIAATNQNLAAKIQSGEFRADLFYRLNVASLNMPALAEIHEDIPLLANHFLAKAACELKIEPKSLSPDVLNHLLLRDWPGNVRELENTIRGWSATIPDEKIQMRHVIQIPKNDEAIQPDIPFEGPYKELKERVIESFTRSYVTRLLENTGGNISFSARVSGIKRQSLQKIINRYNINADDYRQDQTE